MAALEAIYELERERAYDLLVVDEAQDLMTGPARDVLDELFVGGWADGRWCVFLDPRRTCSVRSTPKSSGGSRGTASYVLRLNCRNTSEIARDTAIASETDLATTLPIQGPDPRWIWCDRERDHVREAGKQLNEWIRSGIAPERIVILSRRRRRAQCCAMGFRRGSVQTSPTVPWPSTRLPGARSSSRRLQGSRGSRRMQCFSSTLICGAKTAQPSCM